MAIQQLDNQIIELLSHSESVLIALPYHPNMDAVAGGLALAAAIESIGKKARIVSHDFEMPQSHAFLPKSHEIHADLTSLKKFVISLSLKNAAVEDLSYAIENDALQIYITPKTGRFEKDDVTTSDSNFAYDCIITLDCHDLESLGVLYEENSEFFFATPIVNIDHSPKNERFGQINLVNINATSTSEIIFELLERWEGVSLDEYSATSLLAGMISKTKSFQSGSVTPRSLAIASRLIDQGARRDEIVKHLYQSKSMDTLKLWGKVLSRLEKHAQFPIVWSYINRADFEETGTTSEDIADAIDELIINTPEAKNAAVFFPGDELEPDAAGKRDAAAAVISVTPFIDAKSLFADFAAEGTEQFVVLHDVRLSIAELQKVVLERIVKEYEKVTKK